MEHWKLKQSFDWLHPFYDEWVHKLQGLLYLQNNSMSGSLFGDLCGLQSLNIYTRLSQNQISGSIPECFGNLTSLRSFYIAFNRLTSTLPRTLRNRKDLLGINLSLNFLSGSLPVELGES